MSIRPVKQIVEHKSTNAAVAKLRSIAPAFWALAVLALAAALPIAPAKAEESELGPVFLLSLGGKLYDNAWTILDLAPPTGRNPALKDAQSVASRDTWRCATCHGWDYAGAEIDGTQYPGLHGLSGADTEAIKASILNPDHPFPADRLPELGVELLALFISNGQYQRSELLTGDGESLGNPEFGRDIFEGACISCHQLDGRMFLRGERGDRSSLGWVARNRPEQALHKIINGVPAAEMLSLRFLSEAMIGDILAYLQTLDPTEK